MYKYVVFFLVLLASINFANAFESKLKINQPKTITSTYEGSRRQQRIHPRHCPQCHYNNPYLSGSDLSALEKYALNKTYRRESDLARLERLENLAFGATQIGDIGSRYTNVENAILSRPKFGTKNSILNNIANYFSGSPTGFTPSITTPYMGNSIMNLPAGLGFPSFNGNYYAAPGYSNQNFEQYSNGIFGGGWGISDHNYGIGSGVKILD